ncbi:hypothetical protein QUB10_24770, partial [Microcoleus sp. B5-D4]
SLVEQASCLLLKIRNRQDACSTNHQFSCGTGILPVIQKLRTGKMPVAQKINLLVQQASCLFLKIVKPAT